MQRAQACQATKANTNQLVMPVAARPNHPAAYDQCISALVCDTACRLAAKPLLQHLDQVQTPTLHQTQPRLLTHSLLQLSMVYRQCKVMVMHKLRGKNLHQVCNVYTVCMSSVG